METVKFAGYECVLLENEALRLLIPRSIGPRILSLRFQGGKNLLAELPDFITDSPGNGAFHFYGGHRLWHAPEDPRRTYLPDDSAVDIAPVENGCVITQETEAQTGLQKSLEVRLSGVASVVVTHYLSNRGLWPVATAPWAITQFRRGGTAILPQSCENTGVLPNRSLTLWPYTRMSEPNVEWGQRYILVHADIETPFKVGFPNPRGWLAYWLDDTLFVKRANYEAQSAYYDFGSSSECYCNEQFLELETLAPIQTILPGATVEHIETWTLYGNVERPRSEKDAELLAARLNLE